MIKLTDDKLYRIHYSLMLRYYWYMCKYLQLWIVSSHSLVSAVSVSHM